MISKIPIKSPDKSPVKKNDKPLSEKVKQLLSELPKQSGVYHFLGENAKLLYVGKAKNLRSRVRSYFRIKNLSRRITMMVEQIIDIEWVITANEQEALVLENSHIKNHKPKFNILFRDDKSYPFLCFSAQNFSRISYFRSRQHSVGQLKKTRKDKCLGPYPDSNAVREAIALLQKVFRLRTCTDSVFKNRRRPCLLYQIKRCSAPCVNLISKADYQQSVDIAIKFVMGKKPEVFEEIEEKMFAAASAQNFEKAAQYRDQLQSLRITASSQRIIGELSDNCDLIVCVVEDDWYGLSFRAIRSGAPSLEYHSAGRNNFQANSSEIVFEYLRHKYFKNEGTEIPKKIWLNFEVKNLIKNNLINNIDDEINSLPLAKPNHTREKEWLERLQSQCKLVLQTKRNSLVEADKSLNKLQELIELPVLPKRIECVDVSHLSGQGTVASWVVFVGGKSSSNDYRRYNIRTNTGGDDYGAIRELITRRYRSLGEVDNQTTQITIPELLIVDGGKGQLNCALEIINKIDHPQLNEMKVVGLAKGIERIEGNEEIIMVDENGEYTIIRSQLSNIGFKLMLNIRDEAHRFALTGQKAMRKKQNYSKLEDISGIGAVLRKRLITRFGSLQAVKIATREQLVQVEGVSSAMAEKILQELV